MKSLGQIAYEAYRDKYAWTIPQWKVLKPEVKEAWEASAEAVKTEVMLKYAETQKG